MIMVVQGLLSFHHLEKPGNLFLQLQDYLSRDFHDILLTGIRSSCVKPTVFRSFLHHECLYNRL